MDFVDGIWRDDANYWLAKVSTALIAAEAVSERAHQHSHHTAQGPIIIELRDQIPSGCLCNQRLCSRHLYFWDYFNRICVVINTIKRIECCDLIPKADHFSGV